MKSSAQSKNQFSNDIESLKLIQHSNCTQCGRHAIDLLNAKQNVMNQIFKFQLLVEQFEKRVKQIQTNPPQSLQVQRPMMKEFSSQVTKWCSQNSIIQQKLHNVTLENIELTRVLQELNKPLSEVGIQTDINHKPQKRKTSNGQTRKSCEIVNSDFSDQRKIPHSEYMGNYEKIKEESEENNWENSKDNYKTI